MRAYLIPVFTWVARNHQTFYGILINRKRLMQPRWQMYEGKSMFLGGKVESGETPIAAVIREAREEVGLVVTAEELVPLPFTAEYAFYAVFYPDLTQAFFQRLAGACTEGTLDMVLENSLSYERWPEPDIAQAAMQAVAVVKARVGEPRKA